MIVIEMVVMLVRSILLICVVLLVTGCPRSTHTNLPTTATTMAIQSSQQTRQVPLFTRVYVNGLLNVSLHTGYKRPHIILRGDPRDLAAVVIIVTNGALHVTLGTGYPHFGSVQVEIDSRYLHLFEYHGTGTVTGNQLHTSMLDLLLDNQGRTSLGGQIGIRRLEVAGGGYTEISGVNTPYLMVKLSGKPKVRLAGVVNLSYLDLSNDGWLSLYWVKSKRLTVRGHGKTFIQLAGIVEKLYVELWDTAQFKGRYLRAQRAFVKTHGKSVAEISAVKRQHTLASNTSDVQFFNIPVMKADFMADDGAALDMRDLGVPFIQEYDQYNK